VADRGLNYGDGVFETMRLTNGRVVRFERHLARMTHGGERLALGVPDARTVRTDIDLLIREHKNDSGVVKYVVTRGVGGRGYRGQQLRASRIATLHPAIPDDATVKARWCETRLARNARLAGIKHLNRLEQVLAQNEWSDANIGEGLMLDTEGELICATAANIFLVIDSILVTPDLRYGGVRGVMRDSVIESARRLGWSVEQRAVWPDELPRATEVFVTNAIRGIRSIVQLDAQQWLHGPFAKRLQTECADA
jgi:4-amino-4-deoxychorismate lyase